MPNRGQLNILSPAQETAIRAIGALRAAEIVRISWPAPDGVINYAWWDVDNDPMYANINNWLIGRPLVPAFVAANSNERFHVVTHTSAVGDDVVQMRFSNKDRAFEKLCYKHRGGVKVEIFYFLPQIGANGLAISWWLGHLRTPDSADADFVDVSVANGFRSPQLLLPNRQHASNCGFYFGGELSAAELVGHPCDYNRHIGGTRGTLNGSAPWTFCEHTKEACQRIMGDLLSYGGDDTVVESTLIGRDGQDKTVSTTVGNETRLKEPKRVVYGKRKVRALHLLAFAKEFHPDDDHQDLGTLRTLFEVSEGRIKSITNIKVMDRAPQGLIVKLGAQQQSPTDFSPNVLNYNRTAHIRVNLNPIDPNGIQPGQIVGEAEVEGRDEIKVYNPDGSFVETYTDNRAWCLLDLLSNPWFGHRLDRTRFLLDDFIYLATKNQIFNCDVQGTRSVQQQVYDICLAARWFLPFNWNGIARLLPIEAINLNLGDVPVFSDQGVPPARNILWDNQNNVSRLKISYRDDDAIINAVTLTFEDQDNANIERPLLFEDWQQQYRAGKLYGDQSKRRVEKLYAAYGVTKLDNAVPLGEQLRDLGPFTLDGGIWNNLEVEFAIDALIPEALNLHVTKVIKVVSPKLSDYIDPAGNQFQYFVVKSLVRNQRAELIVKAQAYGLSWWDDLFCENPAISGQVNWECFTNSKAIGGDVYITGGRPQFKVCYAQSDQLITKDGEFFEWTVPAPGVEHYVGLTYGGCTVGTPVTASPPVRPAYNHFGNHHAAFDFYYVLDGTVLPENDLFEVIDNFVSIGFGTYTATTKFKLAREGGKIKWYIDGVLFHTSQAVITGPLRLINIGGPDYNTNPLPFMEVKGAFFGSVGSGCIPNSPMEAVGTTDFPSGVARTELIFVDRLFRQADIDNGIPGVYVGGAPISFGSWSGALIQRNKGAGFELKATLTTAPMIGRAATVLTSVPTGSETVDVYLYLVGQTLPSFTAAEVTAGKGLVQLGKEIFQYRTAVQVTTDPNKWTLSVLSNRGAFCSPLTGHATQEDFMVLDDAVVFVPLEVSEIGVSRQWKSQTIGEDPLTSLTENFTFLAPNYSPITPSDYNVAYDSGRNEFVHTWTPIANPCLIADTITYEIYADSGGSPGALLWSGTASQWREPAGTTGGTRSYHFRAKTELKAGSYVTDSVSFTVPPGAPGVFGRWEPASVDNAGTCEVLFDASCDVVMIFVEG